MKKIINNKKKEWVKIETKKKTKRIREMKKEKRK